MSQKADKYETHVKPHLEKIAQWRSKGMGFAEIAKKLNVHRSAFFNYRKKYDELEQVILNAEQDINDNIEKSLYDSLVSKYVYEEDIDIEIDAETGEEIIVSKKRKKKYVPVNPTLLIFALKNRMPEKWNERHELTKAQITKLKEGTGDSEGMSVEIFDDVPKE